MDYDLSDIKRVRVQLGLTQTDLSDRANVSQSLIAKIESGTIDPGYSSVKKIFDTLSTISSSKEPLAKDIMQRHVITVERDDSIKMAIDKMKKKSISQLPVLDKGSIVGLLSESDILDLISSERKISDVRVHDIMQDTPPIVSETATSKVIMHLLKFYTIVIVSEKGKFKGVITKADILDKMHLY